MTIAAEDDNTGASEEVKLEMPDETPLSVDASSAPAHQQKKNYDPGTTPLLRPMAEGESEKYEDVIIHVLPDSASAINDVLEDSARMSELDVVEKSLSWYQGLLKGFEAHPRHGIFEDALSDPNADWKNALRFGDMNINIGRPNFKNKGRGDSQMSSERLVLSVRSRLGLGAPMQTPMVGSGFYVTHKPLEDADIISLWREVLTETVRLGRVTHGLIFSNNQGLAARAVVRSFVAGIVETTVSDLNGDDIYDHLSINDLPAICQSMATSIYPNGFPITRSVFTQDTNAPKEEISQMIDIRKALFMNGKLFNDDQLAHMTKRIGRPMTLKMVKEYREHFKVHQNTIVDIGDGVKLHLHTPSLREYFDSCEKWVTEITGTVQAALGASPAEDARLRYISQLASSTRLRQYAHYVKAIEEDGELYSTRENVDKTLSSLSSSPEASKKMYKAISEYINSTQVSIVATTSVTEYEDELSGLKWPRLIPIDALSVFFQLVEQKLRGIVSRSLEGTSD